MKGKRYMLELWNLWTANETLKKQEVSLQTLTIKINDMAHHARVLQLNPQCKLLRLGFTVDEVEQIIKGK